MSSIIKKMKRRSRRPSNSQDNPRSQDNQGRRSKEETREEKTRRGVPMLQPATDDEPASTNTPSVTPRKSQTKTRTTRTAMDSVPPAVDAALQDFVSHHINTERIKEEFEQLQKLLPEDGEHRRCCEELARRRGAIPCLDATRVILQVEDDQTDFIHANRIKLTGIDREYILAQTPMPNTVEEFWRMVFQEQSANIIVTSTHYEEGKQSSPCFWPMDPGSYQYYGQMFVNNKRVDTSNLTTTYIIEVLPNGCSNSHMTTIYHYTTWPNSSYVTSHRTLIQLRSQIRAGDSSPLIIVSTEGIGRSAMFLVIDVTLTRLFKGTKTRLLDVATQLRRQRAQCLHFPMTYYFSVQVVLNYIKNKIKKYEGVVEQFSRQLAGQLKTSTKTEDGGERG